MPLVSPRDRTLLWMVDTVLRRLRYALVLQIEEGDIRYVQSINIQGVISVLQAAYSLIDTGIDIVAYKTP